MVIKLIKKDSQGDILGTEEITTWSPKEPLPFDGIPHTMELFEGQIILGFESSIYSIPFSKRCFCSLVSELFFKGTEIRPVPDFESLADNADSMSLTKKIRPKNFKGHMRQYFEERPFPDVTFRVQGEEISANKGILSVRCPFFQELFEAEKSTYILLNPFE